MSKSSSVLASVLEERPPAGPRATPAATETIWSLIETRATAHPGRTAILDRDQEIDYERLTDRAHALAAELAFRGVERGSLVAVCMGRGWELVAAILGVLRAGCAYVPLDPAYPPQRVRTMLEHSRATAALVDRPETAELCAGVPEVVRVDEVGESTVVGVPGITSPEPGDLAYVMYTSGTTGRPKGVAVEHRSLVAFSRSMGALFGAEELAGVLASASVCFDASVLELLGTLSLGGTVVLVKNVLELPELPTADRVRMIPTVPAALQALLTTGWTPVEARCVILGGEVLKSSLVDRLHELAPGLRVVNVYGPTETTVYVTATEVARSAEAITIGKPVPGTRAYILNDSLREVPAGQIGELYLAGEQLARGYLHEEELTRQRFLDLEPGGAIPEARLYKTGDRCQRRDDGEIEFLGRIDQQVKVRGFRVEVEEIESVLETMEGVDGAAAAVVDGGTGQKTLVAYVVSQGGTEAVDAGLGEAARAYLAERLPEYMVPSLVMPLDELPRQPSGKLDRQGLPDPPNAPDRPNAPDTPNAPDISALSLTGLSRDERYAALLSVIRGEIATLMRLGGAERVPSDGSVFDLGLDSLTAVELSSRIAARIGRKVPATAAIEHFTPAALATSLAESLLDSTGSARELAGEPGREPTGETVKRSGATDALGSLQTRIQSCYPPFLAAKAACWSVDDKAKFLRELQRLVSGPGQDPHSKVVRTGSASRGIVADVHTREERETIIWTTNLYLGLNRDPEVIEAAGEAVERFGTGMGTSAVAGGVTDLHLEFERSFAELVGKPAACLFPTGYTANLGVIAGILGENDVVVMDQLCHASIVDGARLSGAKIRTFQHSDPADLESVLETEASPYRTVLVVLEGVYSMGEGAAPVEEIVRVAKRHGALVLVDEAHSFGFYGPKGAGLCAARSVTDQVDFIMTTLSKALGSLGGVIAASEEHIALLQSSARAYIFQASTSPAAIAAAVAALRRIRDDDALRDRLWDTTAYMRRRFTDAGYDLGPGDTPVITPHFPDKDKLFAIVEGLFERGVLASAVTYPVVESGKSRLRFICSAAHTREDVDKTLEALIDAEHEAERTLGIGRADSSAPPDKAFGFGEWARSLAAYLQARAADSPGLTSDLAPQLAVTFEPPHGDPITLVCADREVRVEASVPEDLQALPSCTLRCTNHRAASALCSADVPGLLDCVLQGSLALGGQVEPFIWLIGRLVDQRHDASR